MFNNPFHEEIPPDVQPEPSLAQLEAIFSHPITCYLGEEANPHLATSFFQAVAEIAKFPSDPPFLLDELPQLLLTEPVLQTLSLLHCPSLGSPQPLDAFLVMRDPELDTALQVDPHQEIPQEHRSTALVLLPTLFLIQARMPQAFFNSKLPLEKYSSKVSKTIL
ncbi:hypothetical protein TURU_114682 [Turdus rufiventris]|nr:hypothetical protein TURU_114682 [Turdus rufiventris]